MKKNNPNDKILASLNTILRNNKDGSFQTINDRKEQLSLSLKQIRENGFNINDVSQLKGKHIRSLVERWKKEELSAGTLKNRMSKLRWLAEKIGNPRIVERENSSYGIERKITVTNKDTGKNLNDGDLTKVKDEYLKLSLKLQENFGLRRAESMKFQIKFADREDKIVLKGSWTKGGRYREIPITNEKQRELLNEIHRFTKEQGATSLIPPNKSYAQQLKLYEKQTADAGLHRNHGLRHKYAQNRYFELTGSHCPKQGGKTFNQLTPSERLRDNEVRLQISQELGHNRVEITSVYLGR